VVKEMVEITLVLKKAIVANKRIAELNKGCCLNDSKPIYSYSNCCLGNRSE